MTLEELRTKAFFQNTIDVWVMFCEEKNWEPYDTNRYRRFISYLDSQGMKMQKFPLCIKESGGMYERGKEKTKFVEQLSQYSSDDGASLYDKTERTISGYYSIFWRRASINII